MFHPPAVPLFKRRAAKPFLWVPRKLGEVWIYDDDDPWLTGYYIGAGPQSIYGHALVYQISAEALSAERGPDAAEKVRDSQSRNSKLCPLSYVTD